MIESLRHESNVGELRLKRPPVNALDASMLRSFTEHLEAAQSECEAIIITGAPGVFSGGLDVPGMLALDRDGVMQVFAELWRAQCALAHCQVPVVFGLTGHCPAGGTVLAIHGDYRVMALGNFRLGLNEVQVGLYPGPVIAGAFARLTGGHSAQLLTRGALLDPQTALRVGLVDELCAPEDVLGRALAVALEFVKLPRAPMQRTRALTRQGLKELFGAPGEASTLQGQFAALAADLWFVTSTQEMLRKMFVRKTSG